MYFASNLQSSISINHTFSLQSLNSLIDQQETNKKKLDTFSRLSGKNLKFSKKLELGGESTVINELHIMQDPPEAIVCDAVLEKDVRYYVPADQRSIVGLIMLPKVKKAVVTNDRYKIGIDFGTTNTCIHQKK